MPAEVDATDNQNADNTQRRKDGRHVSSKAMAQIIKNATEKGQRNAIKAHAKQLGYKDAADMNAALQRATQQQAQPVQETPKPAQPVTAQPVAVAPKPQTQERGDMSRKDKDKRNAQPAQNAADVRAIEQFKREKEDLKRKFDTERRRNDFLREQIEATKAEAQLKVTAVQAGISDPDYALHLLHGELAGKTADEIAQFDENVYFKGLKKSRPHLFTASAVAEPVAEVAPERAPREPATTGTGGDGQAQPRTADAQRSAAGAKKFDAMKATPQEIDDYMRQRGITPPNATVAHG